MPLAVATASVASVATILAFLLAATLAITNQVETAVANVAQCLQLSFVVRDLRDLLEELAHTVDALVGAPLRSLDKALKAIQRSWVNVEAVMKECAEDGFFWRFMHAGGRRLRLQDAERGMLQSMQLLTGVTIIMLVDSSIVYQLQLFGRRAFRGLKGLVTDEYVKTLYLAASPNMFLTQAAGTLRAVMGLPVGGGPNRGGGSGGSAGGSGTGGDGGETPAAPLGEDGKTSVWKAAAARLKAKGVKLLAAGAGVDASDQAGKAARVVSPRNNFMDALKARLPRGTERRHGTEEETTALLYAAETADALLDEALQPLETCDYSPQLCGLGSFLSPKLSASKKKKKKLEHGGGAGLEDRAVAVDQRAGSMQSFVDQPVAPPPAPQLLGWDDSHKTLGLLLLLVLGLAMAVLL